MNKREKEVFQHFLGAEEDVLHELEKQYKVALKDINEKIRLLQTDELTQSRIYQIEYQKALKGQIEGILDKLHGDEYSTIQKYLHDCYQDAFIGTVYDIAGQGIPLIMPIDQKAAVRAIMTDSKISDGLYAALGVDTKNLKKSIRQEITRGISTGQTYEDIARTEGHRIQQASTMDAQVAAKAKGADVVKQWDSTMDGATRPLHQRLDGQIREVDQPFQAGGKKAMYPGDFGDPAEDCNCRCASLTRARWGLDEDELQTLKDRAEFFGLDKSDDFEDFKGKYLSTSQQIELRQSGDVASPPKNYDGVFDDFEELNLSKKESEALTSLWSTSKESGFEYGAVIENGVVSKPVTSNLPDAVKISLDGFGKGLTVLHSHTNATPPSAADFQRLLNGQVDKIGVIGYNGDAYMAYIGFGETPSLDDFVATAQEISRQVDLDLLDDPDFFDWTIAERNYMGIREQAFRIARHYGWTLEGGRIDVE